LQASRFVGEIEEKAIIAFGDALTQRHALCHLGKVTDTPVKVGASVYLFGTGPVGHEVKPIGETGGAVCLAILDGVALRERITIVGLCAVRFTHRGDVFVAGPGGHRRVSGITGVTGSVAGSVAAVADVFGNISQVATGVASVFRDVVAGVLTGVLAGVLTGITDGVFTGIVAESSPVSVPVSESTPASPPPSSSTSPVSVPPPLGGSSSQAEAKRPTINSPPSMRSL
jgi:hypothetical protein